MSFMSCVTCHRVVQSNATGMCLGCQQGFNHCFHEGEQFVDKDNSEEIKNLEKQAQKIEEELYPQPIKRKPGRPKKNALASRKKIA